MQKTTSLLILLALSLVNNLVPGPAVAVLAADGSRLHEEVDKELAKSWSSSRGCPAGYTEIAFAVGDDGKIYDPILERSSKDFQYDAECLEAVTSISPVKTDPNSRGYKMEHRKLRFSDKESLKPNFDGSDVKEYERTHKIAKDKEGKPTAVLVHKIPVNILNRYPGMFAKEEIISTANIIEVPVDRRVGQGPGRYTPTIAAFYADWAKFLKKSGLKKEEILKFAASAKIH